MNRKKPYIYKRVFAYIIDLIIITLLSGVLTLIFTDTKEYNADSEKIINLTTKLTNGEIKQEDFYKEFDEINYDLTLHSKNVTIITVSVVIVYYVIMCYFCHGITLGKYIMKIKIVSANGKKLNILNYFLRSLIINSILNNCTTLILISILDKQSFINIYSKVSSAFTLLIVISFILMMYRDDGRGIHDLISNTKVSNLNDMDNEEIDANIISEKKNEIIEDKGSVKNERTIRTRNSKKR